MASLKDLIVNGASRFIGKIYASNGIEGNLDGAILDYNDKDRAIHIGYSGPGLTESNLTHVAGYTEGGTKIKDVSKDVLKYWLGIHPNSATPENISDIAVWDESDSIIKYNSSNLSVGYANSAGNASTLNGYGSDVSASGNSIVRRSDAGYIYGTHFNQGVGVQDDLAVSEIITGTGDGWYRRSSLQHVKDAIGSLPANGGTATAAHYANQLQAFVNDDFTSGDHFIKAIREDGWWMRLKTCYNGGAATTNQVRVGYADNADTLDGRHVTGFVHVYDARTGGHNYSLDAIKSWGDFSAGMYSGGGPWGTEWTHALTFGWNGANEQWSSQIALNPNYENRPMMYRNGTSSWKTVATTNMDNTFTEENRFTGKLVIPTKDSSYQSNIAGEIWIA